jgi:hypothetical protein
MREWIAPAILAISAVVVSVVGGYLVYLLR